MDVCAYFEDSIFHSEDVGPILTQDTIAVPGS
jgi:hypothetical protein